MERWDSFLIVSRQYLLTITVLRSSSVSLDCWQKGTLNITSLSFLIIMVAATRLKNILKISFLTFIILWLSCVKNVLIMLNKKKLFFVFSCFVKCFCLLDIFHLYQSFRKYLDHFTFWLFTIKFYVDWVFKLYLQCSKKRKLLGLYMALPIDFCKACLIWSLNKAEEIRNLTSESKKSYEIFFLKYKIYEGSRKMYVQIFTKYTFLIQ